MTYIGEPGAIRLGRQRLQELWEEAQTERLLRSWARRNRRARAWGAALTALGSWIKGVGRAFSARLI